ncbi:MAG: ComEC/Rec2 family competence protein [Opitutaceae bacterium]
MITFSIRRLALSCCFVPLVFTSAFAAASPVVGQPLPTWERGMLDIHQINTGTGDAGFYIFPDGTTMMLDTAGVNRTSEREPNYDSPARPDGSQRAGQWVARYIRRFHPEGERGALDYAALTHFHGDHMGTLMPDSPMSPSGAYKLTGITDVGNLVQIRTMIDRGWPDYSYPAPSGGAMMLNYRAFLKWQSEHRGLKAERFEPGRADQIALRKEAKAYPRFKFQNIAANGHVWTGSGTTTRNRFPDGILPSENNCSLAFRLSYGTFAYFNGGDMAGFLPASAQAWNEMESAVAWVTGPVDVHDLNHHGTPDGASTFFLSVLRPRIHILSTYASSQPGPDLLRRLLSERIYPGPRDVFMTNGMWPGRREHMVKLYGEPETVWLIEQFKKMPGTQGHVVVRVDAGGGRYRVMVVDDSKPEGAVRSIHGPYESRALATTVSRKAE